MYKSYESEGIKENQEKEIFGNSTRELFFQLNKELEKRIVEIKDKFISTQINEIENLFVETLLVDKTNIFKFYGGFYPIVNKNNNMEIEDDIYLEDIYLEMQYQLLEEVENQEFEAWISIGEESYEIKIKLEKDKRYDEKLMELYDVFKLNGQKWNTLNMAHIQRMYRIKLVDYDFEMTSEILNGIKLSEYEISYDFRNYNENILRNMELLWNIEEKQILSSIFVRPTKVDISFEYVLRFEKDEKLLVKNNKKFDILCTHVENDDELHIISRNDNETLWNVFSVKSVELCRNILKLNKDVYEEEKHFTNYREVNFIDILKNRYNNKDIIESISELEKIFLEYSFLKGKIEFSEVIFDKNISEKLSLYDCNYYVKNNFSQNYEKKVINIFIKCLDKNNYTIDMISFIISVIQQKIPNYKCQGVVYE